VDRSASDRPSAAALSAETIPSSSIICHWLDGVGSAITLPGRHQFPDRIRSADELIKLKMAVLTVSVLETRGALPTASGQSGLGAAVVE